jgi:predicted ArsR family transcriptional regulator
MEPRDVEQQITGLAALDDPVRRSLYFYVVGRQREVSRDEAARAVGISRTLAGFHLDRLAGEGLLDTSFRRLSGRAGPGAGRPAKLYRRSGRQLEVSLPQRSYELAATILATAIDTNGTRQTHSALRKAARSIGARIGADAKARAGSRASKKRLLTSTVAALAAHGYEPEHATGELRLRNCPFHALVSEHKDLVCGMNLALIEGVVEGLALPGTTPVLDPKPGMCCVALRLGTK